MGGRGRIKKERHKVWRFFPLCFSFVARTLFSLQSNFSEKVTSPSSVWQIAVVRVQCQYHYYHNVGIKREEIVSSEAYILARRLHELNGKKGGEDFDFPHNGLFRSEMAANGFSSPV